MLSKCAASFLVLLPVMVIAQSHLPPSGQPLTLPCRKLNCKGRFLWRILGRSALEASCDVRRSRLGTK